jgi:hypothetical protein
MPRIAETARSRIMPGSERALTLMATNLGDDAGITGAAVLARRALETRGNPTGKQSRS